jgi:Capsule polysaccharide biosynthesis protein
MTHITLIAAQSDLTSVEGRIGFLCETAPDGTLAVRYPQALPVGELIGDFSETKQRANDLSERLFADEPPLRGVQQLRIFEEIVLRELQYIFHAINLHERLRTLGIGSCAFSEPSRYAAALSSLNALTGSEIMVHVPRVTGSPIMQSLKRSSRRLMNAGQPREKIWRELRLLGERIDPFHTFPLWRTAQGSWRPGEIWFYSTAVTFTKIGQLHEPHCPGPFRYLVENPATGGAPLKEQSRAYTSIYEFGSAEFIPKSGELAAAKTALRNHFTQASLQASDSLARDLFLDSRFVAGFFDRMLAQGLYSTALFDNWTERVQPAALVVGNPVFEGYALHAARKQSIPTVLLQHGILGDFCQFADPPADHYIVRGRFWREFLSVAAAAKAKILNPAEPPITRADSADRRAILFLTAPFSMQEFWHSTDLDDILRTLLQAAFETNAELIIRVHPLESLGAYKTKARELSSTSATLPKVTFSQGASLDPLLERSAVAVTFASTAFLDCLRHRVPVVSFRWHDFSFRRQLEEHGVFLFAASLAELRQILQRAIHGDLLPFAGDIEPFLARTPAGELRQGLRGCMKPMARTAGKSCA